ncbi:uncharacterized protein EKO05_0007016 [Ascochyta rabiei]|uniref:Uncharacterized protein n=1 Tax=Didymella rabiei TaxID=5454 RepID=A0A162Z0H8_DIDRA|nr:uncharacterized protein EKO05_0007016 [Ascochyta rabiei]KZM20332.1 hypothetical protein ST47_g8422 [Ascochyta rabiei]UPX16626.1 hypothetical protein EKO05_0007016 [Ascochyta rabiei]
MSSSQPPQTLLEKRNKTVKRLESHTEASQGPETDETDGSTPRLLPLPRPGPVESSPEPSPDTLQEHIATQSIIRPSRNAFARPDDRPGFGIYAGSSESSVLPVSHSSCPGASSEPPKYTPLSLSADEPIPRVGDSTPRLSDVITPSLSIPDNAALPPYAFAPTEGGFDFELPAQSPNANETTVVQPTSHPSSTGTPCLPSTPDLHVQPSVSSLRAALYPRPTPTMAANHTIPRRQVQLGEHIPDELPTREEPPALTTIARIQRSLARTLQIRTPPTNVAAAIEMNDFPSSAGVPRLAHDGEAVEQRRRVEERQRLETEITERGISRGAIEERRQRAYRIWTPVCVIAGVVLFAVIYVSVTKGE